MCNILGQFVFNFAIEIWLGRRDLGSFKWYWCRWGWSEFPFLAFLCRVCILLVFLRSFFSIFILFFRLFPFSAFLRFSLFLLVSKEFSVFCTFPGSCCRLSLSLRLRGNCKNPEEKVISLRPRLHQLRQKLSERCSFFKTQTQWPKL